MSWQTPLWVIALGAAVAFGPLVWVALRERNPLARLRALTWLTLFLTFDLIVVGAYTRLSDSGLGCPDWPGCYGQAHPWSARAAIGAAQAALPSGPVTQAKAWVEMLHRYLATAVGLLITVLALANWALRGRPGVAPRWAAAAWLWVCVQGAFGAYTVTMRLYPALVAAHLLGGMALLALLAAQSQFQNPEARALPTYLRRGAAWLLAMVAVQVALGAWVSSNYAVLACNEMPTCQGVWWPEMDFRHGFAVLRPLGVNADGGYLPFAALTAIHVVHRLGALIVLPALCALALCLHLTHAAPWQRAGRGLALLAAWQLLSGVANVVWGWPLATALAHTAGAAALVGVLAALLARRGAP